MLFYVCRSVEFFFTDNQSCETASLESGRKSEDLKMRIIWNGENACLLLSLYRVDPWPQSDTIQDVFFRPLLRLIHQGTVHPLF